MAKTKLHILDLIIFSVFIFAIVLSFLLLPSSSDTLKVNADGKSYAFSLNEDAIYSVEGPLGVTTIEIKDKRARIIDSPCPNKTCISAGWSQTLVCLPNRVIATSLEEEDEVDATSS